ncbi:HPr family phosphocarrier protein [Caproiciproducens galactitolivorans]|mgnify:CR=1 FL=1|uniref:HPr family phosphocarrier protein n=1 Tax=Caproiciproducens galactitolivorans TaxID=642589 RepID=A0ABT4BR92_9FIRM|nr:HPr family phosphocarrier protein [Caproiciproducens galactitolivorans]MCY1713397.1 HPr family phosphocarrier protein [Caproiciproducens galactitolivorans]
MKSFDYTIKDELGLHARPAGALSKKTAAYQSEITLTTKGKTVNAKRLFAIMSLAVKKGDEITLSFEGPDEEAACAESKAFCEENF